MESVVYNVSDFVGLFGERVGFIGIFVFIKLLILSLG